MLTVLAALLPASAIAQLCAKEELFGQFTPLGSPLEGEQSVDVFGYSVSSAGDVDGDGRAEILVGAYLADPGGRENAGAAYVYSYDNATSSFTPLGSPLEGERAGDSFGLSVSSAGDLDGDGRAEIVVGAPRAGAAYVYSYGSQAIELCGNGLDDDGDTLVDCDDPDCTDACSPDDCPETEAELLWPMELGQKFIYRRAEDSVPPNSWTVTLEVTGKAELCGEEYYRVVEWNYDNKGESEVNYYRSTKCEVFYCFQSEECVLVRAGAEGESWSCGDELTEILPSEFVTLPNLGPFQAFVNRKQDAFEMSPFWIEFVVPGLGIVREVDYWTDDAPKILELVEIQSPNHFLRGDGNSDGATDIADPVYVLNHLFGGGPAPSCMQTADANDDSAVNVADPVYQLNHLFGGGPPLSSPVGECGTDPTPAANADDDLSCDAYPPCEA